MEAQRHRGYTQKLEDRRRNPRRWGYQRAWARGREDGKGLVDGQAPPPREWWKEGNLA